MPRSPRTQRPGRLPRGAPGARRAAGRPRDGEGAARRTPPAGRRPARAAGPRRPRAFDSAAPPGGRAVRARSCRGRRVPARRRRIVERAAHLHRRLPVGRAGQRGRGARRGPAAAAGGARGLPRSPRRVQPRRGGRRGGTRRAGITLLGSPQTVVSEGLAECALGTAVGPRWGRWASDVLAPVAVPSTVSSPSGSDPVLAVLRRVRLDAAPAGARRRTAHERRSRPPRRRYSAGCCSRGTRPAHRRGPLPPAVRAQVLAQGLRALVAARGVLLQCLQDDGRQVGRQTALDALRSQTST
jgi:hypothetical protein